MGDIWWWVAKRREIEGNRVAVKSNEMTVMLVGYEFSYNMDRVGGF